MIKKQFLTGFFLFGLPFGIMGCNNEIAQQNQQTPAEGAGTLKVVANGESIIRDGLRSKDGWDLSFNHVYVTLNNIKAHQTNPPFDPDSEEDPQPTTTATILESPETVDLAGDAATPTITTAEAPAGMYNAFAWEVVPAETGEAEEATVLLEGTAEKQGRSLDFTISLNQPLASTCGEYVGDERKGIVEAGEQGELEATFHFDHLFGIAELPADDPMNAEALGFEPFVQYAEGDSINVNSQQLQANLNENLYETLISNLKGLPHVGEGHCRVEQLN